MRRSGLRWLTVLAALFAARVFAPSAHATDLDQVLVHAPVSVDFFDYLLLADRHKPLTRLDFEQQGALRYLYSGWNLVERDPETGEGQCWTRDRQATICVPVVEPKPITLRFTARAEQPGKYHPVQDVRVLWNNQQCARDVFDVKDRDFECSIPAAVQRFGPNLLTIETQYWTVSGEGASRNVAIPRGLLCRRFEFATEQQEVKCLGRPANIEQGVLEQAPGSVLTFYFALPERAVLRARACVHADPSAIPEAPPGQVVVAFTPAGGPQRVLMQRAFADVLSDPEITLEADLRDYAGQMAAFTLSFPVASVDEETDACLAESCRLKWEELRLEGVRREPSRAAIEHDLSALRGRFNIFIVLFDTLRADYTEAYRGLDAAKTPYLARLADSGTAFLNTYSNSSWTRTSVSSILTGLTPQSHGVVRANDSLPPTAPYLPALLREHGYRTAAVINMPNIGPAFGFARGFDEVGLLYEDRYKGAFKDVVDPAQSVEFVWKEHVAPFVDADSDKPFFIYLHEVDPHAPWDAPEKYERLYDFGYQGKIDCRRDIVNLIRERVMPLTPLDVKHLKGSYKAEITFMDDYLAALMSKLRGAGLAENTVVLFISDHGEEMYEHGCIGHYWHHHNEVLRVPMIWSLPGVIPAARRPQAVAQLLDVSPTLLDMVGAPVPDVLQGRSLLPFFVLPDTTTVPVPCFGRVVLRTVAPGEPFDSVVFHDWKLLRRLSGDPMTRPLPVFSLYDLSTDPGESLDWWPTRFIEGRTLLQMLRMAGYAGAQKAESLRADAPEEPAKKPELSKEVIEDLRSLGCLN